METPQSIKEHFGNMYHAIGIMFLRLASTQGFVTAVEEVSRWKSSPEFVAVLRELVPQIEKTASQLREMLGESLYVMAPETPIKAIFGILFNAAGTMCLHNVHAKGVAQAINDCSKWDDSPEFLALLHAFIPQIEAAATEIRLLLDSMGHSDAGNGGE